jgi:TetR/AcrR family transcriptional regulator, transcriptional repressor for nem operon
MYDESFEASMAALGPEVARSTPEIRTAFERGLKEVLAARGVDRKEAIFQTAALLGGVMLARAVQDPKLSDEILESVRPESRLIW